MQINSFSDLLNLKLNGLILDQATITLNNGSVVVSTKATVFNSPNQDVRITFCATDNQLVSAVDVNFPAMTLRQLAEHGCLPPSSYAPADLPQITFSNIKATPDLKLRIVTVTGDAPAGSLPLGITNLPVTAGLLHLKLYAPEGGAVVNLDAYLAGTLTIASGLPVQIALPRGIYDWRLTSGDGAPPELAAGLGELTSLMGSSVGKSLPGNLPNLAGIKLASLMVQFNTKSPALSVVALKLATTSSWDVVSGLTVKQVEVELTWQNFGSVNSLMGRIAGVFNLLDVDVSLSIPIPATGQDWILRSNPGISIPGIGTLASKAASLVGAGDPTPSLPPGLDTLGNFNIEFVEIAFNPVARTLSNIAFRLAADSDWTIPYATDLALTEAQVDLSIANPLGDATTRSVTGFLSGIVVIGSIFVPVRVQRPTSQSNWTLDVTYDSLSIGLPDLATLAGISQDDFRKAMPDQLSVINDLALTQLSVVYDLTAKKLSEVSFTVELTEQWTIIDGYLSVNTASASLQVYDVTLANRRVFAGISTEIQVVDVTFVLGGARGPDVGWALTAEMAQGDTINLKDLVSLLLNKLLPGNFSLPASLPTVVCTGMRMRLIPATGAFDADLTSAVTWPIPFAHANFEIRNLQTLLNIGAAPTPPATGNRPYTFTASGEFSFMNIAGAASFTTTNTGGDTIIAVTVSNDAGAIKLPSVVKQLTTGAQTGTETWNALLPTLPVNFADFGTLTLDVLINLTQDLFVMYGRSSKYGSIAFFTKKLSENNWGYFVAAKLADGFTFASLLPELSAIDGVLTFKNGSASIAYSSFEADTVQTFTASVPQLSQSLTVGGVSPIQPGVNFYAALNFASATRGALFGNVVTLLSGLENKPDLVVHGSISKNAFDTTNNSLKAFFQATLGDFTVLDVLEFHGVTFQYSRDTSTEVTLSGDMKLTLDKVTPNAPVYSFHGELKVTQTRADFTLTTAQNIVKPLGMTGVTINAGLVFSYVFATTTPPVPAKTTLQLSGTATFGTTTTGTATTFAANLYLVNGNPVLVEVSLTQTPPLGIIALLASSVAGITYPTDYFDIKFLTGSAYYYKKSADPTGLYGNIQLQNNQPIARADGFNLQTTLSMFDQTFSIAVNVQADGLTATGKMLKSFDLDFIEFTDTDFTGSPSLFLRLLQNEKAFGLKAGFKLFKENFATGELSIGKYSSGTVTGTDEAQIRGRLAYAGNIEMFVGTAIGFTYSKSEGFKITDWPFNFDAALDYAQLMNGFSKGGCEKLVGMVFDKAVKTNFSVKPSFSSDATHYILTLKGTYSVALFDASHPFLEVATPDIPIKVDRTKPFSLKSLPDLILQTIADSAQEIVKSILNDPAKFSAFVATVGLVNASESLTANLICNGGEGGAESAEAVEAANAAKTAAETAKAQAEAATTTAEAEAAAADAAAASARAAAAAGGAGGGLEAAIAAAAAAAAAGIAAGIAAGLSFGGGGGTKPVDAPQLDKASIANFVYDGSQLVVSWQRVSHAAAYRAELLSGNDVIAASDTSSSTLRATFSVDKLKPGKYDVQVRANASNYKESVSDKASINVLNAVTVTLSASGEKLLATWNKVDSPNYEVTLFKDGSAISTTTAPDTQKQFDPIGAGAYTVKVRPTGDLKHVAGNLSAASNQVTKLAQPNVAFAVRVDADKIGVTCDYDGDRFDMQLVNGGKPFGSVVTNIRSQTATLLDASQLAVGEYQVQVRVGSADDKTVPSDWLIARNTIYKLAAPVIASLDHSTNKMSLGSVIVTLQNTVPNATRYEAQLVNLVDGKPIGSVFYGRGREIQITPGSDVPYGTYKVQVRATRANNDGSNTDGFDSEWSVSTMTITLFERLTINSIGYANNMVTASWTASTVATSYDFLLSEDPLSPNQPVASKSVTPPAGQTAPPTSVSLSVEDVPKGKTYTAYVRPVANGQTGDWSASVTVTLQDGPAG